ncbi:MAG: hypothetical protein WC375_10855 [Methanomassiliicoccales archaeon]|jgi:hypothetical protein
MAKNKRSESKGAIDPVKLEIGDVVSIEWFDVHAYERIEMSEIDELEEPGATHCWGVVVKRSEKYLFIANEVGDADSDGMWIEALPYKMIEKCEVIDNFKIDDL